MKALVVILLCVLVWGCSESETPLPVDTPEPANHISPAVDDVDPEPFVQHEIPPGIPPTLADSFADLQPYFTEKEYQYLLQQVKLYCDGVAIDGGALHSRLKRDLSLAAYNRVYPEGGGEPAEIRRIPVKSRNDKSRVYLAATLRGVTSLSYGYGKIWYEFSKHGSITIMQTFDHLGRHYVGIPAYGGSRWREIERIVNEFERLNKHNNKKVGWQPIIMPAIPDDLDIAIFYIDGEGNLIEPTAPELFDWVFEYDEAPRATDEQIAAYNRQYAPLAFDCVEQ